MRFEFFAWASARAAQAGSSKTTVPVLRGALVDADAANWHRTIAVTSAKDYDAWHMETIDGVHRKLVKSPAHAGMYKVVYPKTNEVVDEGFGAGDALNIEDVDIFLGEYKKWMNDMIKGLITKEEAEVGCAAVMKLPIDLTKHDVGVLAVDFTRGKEIGDLYVAFCVAGISYFGHPEHSTDPLERWSPLVHRHLKKMRAGYKDEQRFVCFTWGFIEGIKNAKPNPLNIGSSGEFVGRMTA